MNLKDTYNKIAQDWFTEHKESDWWSQPMEKFLHYLHEGDLILDIGCGAGIKTKYIVARGFKAVGIDFSEEMIKLAKQYLPTAEFYVKDINEPLRFSTTFDGIFAQAILLHTPKVKVPETLQNMLRNLKPSGYLFLGVKGIRPGEDEEMKIVERDYGYDYERFFSFYTLPEVKSYLVGLGMEIVYETVIEHNGTEWIIVIAKK